MSSSGLAQPSPEDDSGTSGFLVGLNNRSDLHRGGRYGHVIARFHHLNLELCGGPSSRMVLNGVLACCGAQDPHQHGLVVVFVHRMTEYTRRSITSDLVSAGVLPSLFTMFENSASTSPGWAARALPNQWQHFCHAASPSSWSTDMTTRLASDFGSINTFSACQRLTRSLSSAGISCSL